MGYWVEHFKAFEKSELTQAAYCQHCELNAKLFSSRLGIYRESKRQPYPA